MNLLIVEYIQLGFSQVSANLAKGKLEDIILEEGDFSVDKLRGDFEHNKLTEDSTWTSFTLKLIGKENIELVYEECNKINWDNRNKLKTICKVKEPAMAVQTYELSISKLNDGNFVFNINRRN